MGRPLIYAYPEESWVALPEGCHAPAVEWTSSRSGGGCFAAAELQA